MILAATCATFLAMLATAQGGETIALRGDCGPLTIANRFERRVTIDASLASVRGLTISGANVTWLGGVLVAPDGMDGFAARGYAVKIAGQNIRVAFALVTDAKKGIVVDQARNVEIEQNKFWRLREDGIIASRWVNGSIEGNAFSEFLPRKTQCTLPGGLIYGLSRRDCEARGGAWTDGNHPDAAQLRNAVINVRIRFNTAEGDMQGFGQFDTAGDLPLQGILLDSNWMRLGQAHHITLYDCRGCRIERNIVLKGGDPARRVVIRPGTATTCGNAVEGEKPDAACP